jgi:hypothetical protein
MYTDRGELEICVEITPDWIWDGEMYTDYNVPRYCAFQQQYALEGNRFRRVMLMIFCSPEPIDRYCPGANSCAFGMEVASQ